MRRFVGSNVGQREAGSFVGKEGMETGFLRHEIDDLIWRNFLNEHRDGTITGV